MIPIKKTYIITFKSKNKRQDKETDKIEILRNIIKSEFDVINPESIKDLGKINQGNDIAFDINEFEAPIVTAKLAPDDVTKLRKNTNIERIDEDERISLLQNHVHNKFSNPKNSWGIDSIQAGAANNITRGTGIKVAILDTGIDYKHEQLVSNYKDGASFVEDENEVMDHNGHGTAVAGIIGSRNKEVTIGVAPNIDIYALKIVNRKGIGNTSYILNSLEWCIKNNMHLINMSLGDSGNNPNLEVMCNLAWSKGILIVSAAGNNGKDVVAPAKYLSTIAVSAIDKDKNIYPNSSRGPEVELCAPGVEITSTLPGDKYGLFTGTSFACPHVTAAAGLSIASHRWSPENLRHNIAIRRLLISTVDKITPTERDEKFGFGKVNAERSVSSFAIPNSYEGVP